MFVFHCLVGGALAYGDSFSRCERLPEYCSWGLTDGGCRHAFELLETTALCSAYLDSTMDEVIVVVTQRERSEDGLRSPPVPACMFGLFGLTWDGCRVSKNCPGHQKRQPTDDCISEGLPLIGTRHALAHFSCSKGAHLGHHQRHVEIALEAGFRHEAVREQPGNEFVMMLGGEYVNRMPVIGTGPLVSKHSGRQVGVQVEHALYGGDLSSPLVHVAFEGLDTDYMLEAGQQQKEQSKYRYTVALCDGSQKGLCREGCLVSLSPVLCFDEEKYPWAWVLDVPVLSEGGYLVTLDATPLPIYSSRKELDQCRGAAESVLGSPDLEVKVSQALRAQETSLESWIGMGAKKTLRPRDVPVVECEGLRFRLLIEITGIKAEGQPGG